MYFSDRPTAPITSISSAPFAAWTIRFNIRRSSGTRAFAGITLAGLVQGFAATQALSLGTFDAFLPLLPLVGRHR